MKNEKIVKYNDIGHVLYRKNSRARNISIRISRGGEVKVTVPRFCNYHAAEAFLLKKKDWIRKKQLDIKRINSVEVVWQRGSILSTPEGRIFFEEGSAADIEIKQSGRNYQVFLPVGFREEDGQDRLRGLIANIGLKEAKLLLPQYLKRISEEHNLEFRRVTVRRMKSRWGSCSPENNISLNSALIFMHYPLIEYVLLHELVHTVHKNHSERFWGMVEKLMPDAKIRRKELNKISMI